MVFSFSVECGMVECARRCDSGKFSSIFADGQIALDLRFWILDILVAAADVFAFSSRALFVSRLKLCICRGIVVGLSDVGLKPIWIQS